MIHYRTRVYGDHKMVSVSIKETDASPLHTTAYAPGYLDGGNYVITDIDALPNEAKAIINRVWTPDVHSAYQQYLRDNL